MSIVRTPEEVRQQRTLIEARIAECQNEIADFVSWREQVGDVFRKKAHSALDAVEERDRLLLVIAVEALWAFDYESATDYYEQKGFSRQRLSQIKYEVVWKQLVGDLDESLPAPNGHHSRHFGSTDPDIAIPAYRRAVQESGGALPSESKTKELLTAAKEGVQMDDEDAIAKWRDRRHLQQIELHFNALTTESARKEARKIVK